MTNVWYVKNILANWDGNVYLPITRCNFPCNLQRNSTPKSCKFVTNVWYAKNILANCDGNMYLPILYLPRVELHCKLQEKLHRVTGPLVNN